MTLSVFSLFFFIGNSFVLAQDIVNPKVVDLCKKAKHELNQQKNRLYLCRYLCDRGRYV